MSNHFDTAADVHLYKPKKWTFVLNIFSLLFIGIVVGIPLLGFALMFKALFQNQTGNESLVILFTCLLAPLMILLVVDILILTTNVILSIFSYIKVSPGGIEQRNPIRKHIHCNWAEVDRLGKYFLFRDVLYLKSYQVLGLSTSLQSPFRKWYGGQAFISLRGYEGWPDGQLARDLKYHAPQLFEDQQTHAQENQLEKKLTLETAMPGSEISQEDRLLAALSNASILFSYMGVIVPMIIYVTQRKRSSYLAFQALQALVWQIMAFLFSILTSSCMVGAIVLPVLLATTSQQEEMIGWYGSGMAAMIIFSVVLLMLGNIAFTLYGIAGAIMTYQGKDFRYVLIGNRIQKQQLSKPVNGT